MIKKIAGSILLACMILFAGASFAQDQKVKDEQILTEYFAKNNIKATRTASGLYYTVNKPGAGAKAKAGQRVTMNYLGKFLDGKVFDGNMDASYNAAPGRQPFPFTLGQGQVIRGWDEGIALLNNGERATLYIPSGMAYGPNGRGPIPANSVLVFDVEVLDIK